MKFIVRALESGVLVPGERLGSEREVAEHLGVSRASWREAVAALEAIGVLRANGSRYVVSDEPSFEHLLSAIGTAVLLSPREEMLADLREARRVIERETVRLAATRSSSNELARLTVMVVEMSKLTDPEAFVAADTAFHVAIARASHNRIWTALLQLVRTLVQTEMMTVANEVGRLESASREHLEIVQALTAGDTDAAVRLIDRHVSRKRT